MNSSSNTITDHNANNPIDIILAVKGRTDNLELHGILSSLNGYNLRIKNLRTVNDLLDNLKEINFDLLICDSNLLKGRVSKLLSKHLQDEVLPPVVIVTHENTNEVRNISKSLNTLQTLVLDQLDQNGLEHFISLAVQYSLLNRQHNFFRNDTDLGITLSGTFSFRANLDENGTPAVHWVSKSFESITGYNIKQLKKLPHWMGNVDVDDYKLLTELEDKIKNNEPANCTFRARDNHNNLLWLEIGAQPQLNKEQTKIIGMVGNVRNITERKNIEEHIIIQKQRRNLIKAIEDSIDQLNDTFAIFKECALATMTELEADLCEVFITHKSGDEFVLRYNSELDKGNQKIVLPLGKNNEAEYISLIEKTVCIESLKSIDEFKPSRYLRKHKMQSIILSPIMHTSNIMGMMVVYKKTEKAFSDLDAQFTDAVAHSLANTINQTTTDTLMRFQAAENNPNSSIAEDQTLLAEEEETTLSEVLDKNIETVFQSALDLRTRDAVMSVIARISEWFLQAPNWQSVIEQSMAALSQAVLSPGARLYKIDTDLLKSTQCSLIYSTHHHPEATHAPAFNLQRHGFIKFQEVLKKGKPLIVTNNDVLSRTEVNHLSKTGFSNNLILPIFVNNSWWGFVAFSAPTNSYIWPKPIVNAFRVAANIIGPAISRSEHEKSLHALTEATVANSGQEYLDSLVKQVGNYTQADICFISEINDDDSSRIISIWDKNNSLSRIDYSPNEAPHNEAQSGINSYYPENASKTFPKNKLFKQHKIESYTDLAINLHGDRVIGNLVIMGTMPLHLSDKQIQILEICSNRVGLELERIQRELDVNRLARIPLESPYMIMILDLNGDISFSNPSCRKMLRNIDGKMPQELLPGNHQEIIDRLHNEPNNSIIKAEVTLGNYIIEWDYHHEADIELIHLYGIDLTDRRQLENQLRKDAFNDSLTNLPNRAYFNSVLERALEHIHRRKEYQFAVLFLDLDRFKIINDSLGHLFGDKLLQEVANRLKNTLRPGDTVARLGGDEFAILLDAIENQNEVITIAKRVITSFSSAFLIDENEIFTSTSIGIAISNSHYQAIEEVIRDADIAMYSAKNNGKGDYAIFDAKMHKEAVHVMNMENDLRNALGRNELECYYQPIYSFDDKTISGFETLVRWNHPTKGVLMPDEFINLAEETGFIREIDLWVFDTACKQLSEWQQKYPQAKNLSVNINLSAIHFNRVELIAHIGSVLDRYELNPESIRLEVTESVIMESINYANEIFSVLKNRGIKISIDDFGVGYSSLGRLISLPVDALKIDRSFIISVTKDRNSRNITRAIIDLAQVLSLDVIAEGVETIEQLNLLERLGCNFIQGFYIEEPVNARRAERLIKKPFKLDRF